MAIETRDARMDAGPVLLTWGAPATERHEGPLDSAVLWLSGGLALLVWTGLALVLTSA